MRMNVKEIMGDDDDVRLRRNPTTGAMEETRRKVHAAEVMGDATGTPPAPGPAAAPPPGFAPPAVQQIPGVAAADVMGPPVPRAAVTGMNADGSDPQGIYGSASARLPDGTVRGGTNNAMTVARAAMGEGTPPPAPAQPTWGATNAMQNAQAVTANEVFEQRNARAADYAGIFRTNTDVTPVNAEIVMRGAQQRAAATPRQGASELARTIMADLNIGRAQASQERIEGTRAQGMIGKATAERDARVTAAEAAAQARVTAAEASGQARVDAAGVTGQATVQAAQARAEAADRREATRNQMLTDARAERNEARQATTADRRQRWVMGALDKEYSPNGVTKETLRSYMTRTRDAQGNPIANAETDPTWESRLDAVEDQAKSWGLPLFGQPAAPAVTVPPNTDGEVPPVEGAIKSPTKGWVKLREGGNRANPEDWLPVK